MQLLSRALTVNTIRLFFYLNFDTKLFWFITWEYRGSFLGMFFSLILTIQV